MLLLCVIVFSSGAIILKSMSLFYEKYFVTRFEQLYCREKPIKHQQE
jgi:hypothetical protein